jgi:hypothetical protein
MTIFEVVFSLTGLVLGLALVSVLSGLANTMRARSELRAGWLTPLLGIWVLADVTSFWGMAWEIRDLMPSVWPSLGVGLVVTSLYYLAASLVFPDDVKAEPDLDEYFWRNRRTVFALVLGCNVVAWGLGLAIGRTWTPMIWAINGSYLLALMAALIASGRRANIALLALLIAIQAWGFATP